MTAPPFSSGLVPAPWFGLVQIVPSHGTIDPSPFGFGITRTVVVDVDTGGVVGELVWVAVDGDGDDVGAFWLGVTVTVDVVDGLLLSDEHPVRIVSALAAMIPATYRAPWYLTATTVTRSYCAMWELSLREGMKSVGLSED